MDSVRYYKAFKPGRVGPYSGVTWPKHIGAWVSVEGRLEPCVNGIHVARGERELLEHWLEAEVFEVEVRGERIDSITKACVRECRLVRRVLDDRSLRMFAADCAEQALRDTGVTDKRSWAVVGAAHDFANGSIGATELDAARDAAWDAAWNAAWAAAWAAAWDRQASLLRWYIDGEQGDKPSLLEA